MSQPAVTLKKTIKVLKTYRSVKSIQEQRFNCFFIDDAENHFALFINNKSDSYKMKSVGLNLEDFLPLDSDEQSNAFLAELGRKLLNNTVKIEYSENARGNKIEKLEFTNEK